MCMLCLSLSNVFINAYRNIFITYHDSFAFSCTYSTYGKDIIHKSTLCVAEMGKYGVFRVRVLRVFCPSLLFVLKNLILQYSLIIRMHPRDKFDIIHRLSLSGLAVTYIRIQHNLILNYVIHMNLEYIFILYSLINIKRSIFV